jgi:hypothetical protein
VRCFLWSPGAIRTEKGDLVLNPSRTLVICLAVGALILLVLGLATDVGLFGWTLAALVALYLATVAVRRLARPSSSSV